MTMETPRYEIKQSKINNTTQEVKEKVVEVLKIDDKFIKILKLETTK